MNTGSEISGSTIIPEIIASGSDIRKIYRVISDTLYIAGSNWELAKNCTITLKIDNE